MKKSHKVIAWFEEITREDIGIAGGKGANLGEMVHAGIPVPPGFVVTATAYYDFLEATDLMGEIRKLLKDVDANDSRALQDASYHIKEKFVSVAMPEHMVKEIQTSYRKLGGGLVAVRSSATAEDLPDASFAGQQRTFLNIQGEESVVRAVQECWASLFESRAIFYRHEQGFDHFKVGIAVPVQRMIQSEAAGVMFTVEPLSSDRSKILIEAIYGLGEAIVSGDLTPDQYTLDKNSLSVLDKKIVEQDWYLTRNLEVRPDELETNIKAPVPPKLQKIQKIDDQDITGLAAIGKRLEEHYKTPQDVEWAREGGKLYIVQTRPVTTLNQPLDTSTVDELKAEAILTGVAASPGAASGVVKIIRDPSQIDKIIDGDILVAEMTTPDFVPAMKRAVGIITDRGGRTAHAAIVSRELGIPCIVGTERATYLLKDGQEVTVDGSSGKVYSGHVAIKSKKAKTRSTSGARIKTKTKLYVNLAEPELAERIAERDVDGVGLLRAEFIMARMAGHPRYMLHEGKAAQYMDVLTKNITMFTRAFHPRPVVYRTTDFKTNEYRNLPGGYKYEETEENPMIGYRGCSRYTHEVEVFRMELDAIKRVCQSYDNLYVMIPFVRFVSEIVQIKKILTEEGFYQFPKFKLWMMVEVPSNILLMDKFIDAGIDGISIGSNDLTQLILGIDRDNSKLATQFDERNEAVMLAIEKAVTTSVGKGITCSICGQAPSTYPEITEKLVSWGITSISVTPDMIDETRQIIAVAEEKLAARK
ncbi:MAG: phosphoenolpyruvate synthase [Dehalococcoidia bacterium]|nr:phosphoenolpyruvate synthase [Dehalococcoidia bacterium]